MGVAREDGILIGFRLFGQHGQKLPEEGGDFIHLTPKVQPQIQGHLVVSASGGVKLLAHIPQALGQLLLHEHMDVLAVRVEVQPAAVQILQDALQALNEGVGLLLGQDPAGGQHGGVGLGAGDVLPVHPAVKGEGGVEIVCQTAGHTVGPSCP